MCKSKMKSTMVLLLTTAFHLNLPSLSFLVFHVKVCVWCSVGPVVSENQTESKKVLLTRAIKNITNPEQNGLFLYK